MAYTPEQLDIDLNHVMALPGWQDPAKRDDFIRDVAVKTRPETDPETHAKLIDALWQRKDDRGVLSKTGDFVKRSAEEVLKSVPASGMAAVQGVSDVTGLTDTGSQTRITGGVKGLVDATGQRLKQLGSGEIFGLNLLPGESRQKQRDDSLQALKKDLDNGVHPAGLEDWLAGKFDSGSEKPDAETQKWIDALTQGLAKKAVAADHMGEVKPERVDNWLRTDRNPARVESDITGMAKVYGQTPEPGPRAYLADYLVTRDPKSWDAFVNRVTETDTQYRNRLSRMEAEASVKDAMKNQPEGLMKDLTQRGLEMQTSPIDLATAVAPALRGGRAAQAANAGGTATAVAARVLKGGGKEALQEGTTEYLQDPRASGERVAEAAGMGAVGSTVVEGTMAGTGAAFSQLNKPKASDEQQVSNDQTAATPGASASGNTAAPMGGGTAAAAGPQTIGGRPVLIQPGTAEEQAQVARMNASSPQQRALDGLPPEPETVSMAEIAGRDYTQPQNVPVNAAPVDVGGDGGNVEGGLQRAPNAQEVAASATPEQTSVAPEQPGEVVPVNQGRARMAEKILASQGVQPDVAQKAGMRLAADLGNDLDAETFRQRVLAGFQAKGGVLPGDVGNGYVEQAAAYEAQGYSPEEAAVHAENARAANAAARSAAMEGNNRLQFAPLRDVWQKLMSITNGPALSWARDTSKAGVMQHAAQAIARLPDTVKTPDGRTVVLRHNREGGTLDGLAEHLSTQANGSADALRAAYIPRIPHTLAHAAVKVISPKNGNHIYIARYADRGGVRTGHIVVTSPSGEVIDQGPLDYLKTAYTHSEKRSLGGIGDLEAVKLRQGRGSAPMSAADSRGPTDPRGNVSEQSARGSGSTVWVNPESGLTQSQGEAMVKELLKPEPMKRTQVQNVRDALKLVVEKMPWLQHGRLLIFQTGEEFLKSGYTRPNELSAEMMERASRAQGFYDTHTGFTVVIADNIIPEEGETPIRAAARVLMHERVGHEGVDVLMAMDSTFDARIRKLADMVPETERMWIEFSYPHLAGDKVKVALEWLAQEAENVMVERHAATLDGGLKGVARQMWQAIKEVLQRFYANFSRKTLLENEVNEVLRLAADAARAGTADPTSVAGLMTQVQFSTPMQQMLAQAAAVARGEQVAAPSAGLSSLLNANAEGGVPANRTAAGVKQYFTMPAPAPFLGIADAYAKAIVGSSTGFVPIRKVYEHAAAANPGLTPEAFMAAVQAGDNSGAVYLEVPESKATIDAAGPFVLRMASGVPATNMMVMPGALQFSLGGTRIRHAAGTPYRVNDRAWRAILTGSALPRAFTEAVEMTERERKALDQRTAQVGNDLKTAVESYAEQSGQPLADVYTMVNDALSGAPGTNAVLMQVAPVLHQRALEARALLDTLSDAVARTLPVGDLRNTIMLNQGAWMRRSYAAFDAASGWNFDNVMQAARDGRMLGGRDARAIVAAARVFLRAQNPNATAQEIDADMRDLMDRDTVANAITGAAAVRQNITSLLQRRDIPVELRELMGEEKNPIKRFLQSTSFQAQLIHRYQQQLALRQIGLAGGLFQTERGGPDGVFTQQIPADNRAWSGLNGLWTTPQLWQAMQSLQGANTGTDLWSHTGEALKALGNEAKLNRVAMNPDSWVANALGNVFSLVQTGDVFYFSLFRRVREAVGLMRSGNAKPGAVAHNAAQAVQDAQRAMVARLTASGVLGQNFNLRDLEASIPRHLLAWVNEDQTRDRVLGGLKGAIAGQAAGRGFGLPGRVVGGAIGAAVGGVAGLNQVQQWQQALANYVMTWPDAIGRLTGFLGNLETAHAAGMQGDAAYAHAVERTRNTFPDYGRMPEILKTLSRYGGAASFIGFPYEVYRNTIWNLRYAWQDLRSGNPALVERGIKRTIGAAVIGSLVAGGLQAIFQGLAGSDDERNKKWRKWFGAPWEKNGVLVFTNYGEKSVSYFNTSYLVPQATLMELVNAGAAGRDPAEVAGNIVSQVWQQFMGSSVHVDPILSAVMNTDQRGRPVTYKEGLAGAAERIDYAAQTILEPGWAAKLERIEYALRDAEKNGRLHSLEEEMKRFVGMREFTREWNRLVKGKYNEFAKRNTAIREQANKELGLNLPGAKVEALTRANGAIGALDAELKEFEADLKTLGVPDAVVRSARKESSIPRILYKVELDKDGRRVKSIGVR